MSLRINFTRHTHRAQYTRLAGRAVLTAAALAAALPASAAVTFYDSMAGFLGHLDGAAIDMTVITLFVTAGILGSLSGTKLSKLIKPDQLRTSFAVFVMLLAVFLLVDNLQKLV